jgi:hypothetical protein
MLMKGALTKSGLYKSGSQSGWPEGINDLGAGRIAAMDAAGIDVQILSHAVPGVETVEPSLAVNLARQANDTVAYGLFLKRLPPHVLRGSPPFTTSLFFMALVRARLLAPGTSASKIFCMELQNANLTAIGKIGLNSS